MNLKPFCVQFLLLFPCFVFSQKKNQVVDQKFDSIYYNAATVIARVRIEENIRDVVIYSVLTPNGDGMNDYFYMDDVNLYPNNKVAIYNRWGRKIYETTNYDNHGNVFKGYSSADLTIGDELLPTGTYFYTFEYLYDGDGQPRKKRKVGFLHLQSN